MNQLFTTTVTINTGLQKKSLLINNGDNLTEKVTKFVEENKLPKKMYTIIMQRVTQDMHTQITPISKSRVKEVPKTFKMDNRLSKSPSRSNLNQTAKQNLHKAAEHQKQNNRNFINGANKTQKYPTRQSLSPVNKTKNTPSTSAIKKNEIGISKTPKKIQLNPSKISSKSVKVDSNLNLRKLFNYLIKCNPRHIKILSPEYINLKGINRELLEQLQQFFEMLQQNQFDIMTEDYFLAKVKELNFRQRLSKKQYEYCYQI